MAWGGINVVKSGTQIGFIARLLDDVGGILASGSATVKLFEVQDDMTLKSYDWNDNTFKTTALTTATLALTHRTGNNSTQSTGLWTARLTTLTAFTVGNQYVALIEHASASPPVLQQVFQYGGVEGDGSSGTVDANVIKWLGTAVSTPTVAGVPNVNTKTWNDLATVALPLVPATAGRTLVVDAAGLADVNVVKLGPTGSGTAQTARDVGASVLVGDKTGFALSAAGVQAIWDALTSALTTVGSIGKKLADWTIGTAQTGDSFARIGAAGAGLTALGDTRIANLDATISSRLASASYTTPPTAGAIADQVWEETLADHSGTAGSTAAGLNAAGGSGDPWATALPGSYGAGTAGKIVGDNVNATIASRSSHSAADVWTSGTRTLSSFGTLVADVATAVWGAVVRTLTAATNLSIPTAIENADALLARDMSAVTGEAARSPLNAFRFNRNKFTIAGGVLTVYAEDDVTPAWTATITQTAGDPVSASDPA